MGPHIVIVEPNAETKSVLLELLPEYKLIIANDAQEAIQALANGDGCRLVLLDMSLSGHSGFELLYELRTYPDWDRIKIIVFSSVEIGAEVLESRAWEKLMIADYFYKPYTDLTRLRAAVEDALSVA